MTTALENFKQSPAWDIRYDLPTVPVHNNPHIYMAYAMKVISDADKTDFTKNDAFMDNYAKYLVGCQVEPGLFNRWPGGLGSQTSHDEVMGIAYLNQEAARHVLDYLLVHDGEYNNDNEPQVIPEQDNQNRFIWLEPFLKACAGYRVGLISQVLWSTCLFEDYFRKKENLDYSGILKKWLMADKMGKYWLSSLFLFFWKLKMKSLSVGPKYIFQNKYLTEVPVFGENAQEQM